MRVRGTSIDRYLDSPPQWGAINELGYKIFKEGHLELIDEMIKLVMPIINIVYHRSVKWLDDGYYAEEDLLQDAVTTIYRDMRLYWDKYIHVDNYPKYFESISRNIMINAVHGYHNHYKSSELQAENQMYSSYEQGYSRIEYRMIADTLDEDILKLTRRICSYRGKYARILDAMIDEIYLNNSENLESLRSKFRVIGVSHDVYDMLLAHIAYLHKLSYNYYKSIIRGNHTLEVRIKEILHRYESPVYELLSTRYSDTILPEMYAEFGTETTKRFMKTFGGRTLEVPDYQEFCDNMFGGILYAAVKGDRSKLKDFSKENDLEFRRLNKIMDRVEKYCTKQYK